MSHTFDHASTVQQVEQVLSSDGFRRAERLSSLVRFLADRAVRGDGSPVKEYELGVEVFGRAVSYDPRTDPIARVAVRELRLKLAAYYSTEGARDPIRIAIPKGSYKLEFVPLAEPDPVVLSPAQRPVPAAVAAPAPSI